MILNLIQYIVLLFIMLFLVVDYIKVVKNSANNIIRLLVFVALLMSIVAFITSTYFMYDRYLI